MSVRQQTWANCIQISVGRSNYPLLKPKGWQALWNPSSWYICRTASANSWTMSNNRGKCLYRHLEVRISISFAWEEVNVLPEILTIETIGPSVNEQPLLMIGCYTITFWNQRIARHRGAARGCELHSILRALTERPSCISVYKCHEKSEDFLQNFSIYWQSCL